MILALDTATPVGSVALYADEGQVINRYFNVGLQHSQRLFVEIEAALSVANVGMEALQAIAVSIGPGSFTGLRIALSAAKGLCLAADKVLVTVSTLETLAARLPFARLPVCAVLDARKKRFVHRRSLRRNPAPYFDGANYQRSSALVKYSIQFRASSAPCLRQHGICLFELAFVKAAVGQGDEGGFFRQVDQNNDSGVDCGVFIVIDVLEFFRFSSNRENTLTLYFCAFPDGKPGSTFPGNAL